MSAPIRLASESASQFSARVASFVELLGEPSASPALVDASVVYAQGVHAGLSIAIAALQRRERLIDHLSRWEAELRRRSAREPHDACPF